jgi:hypothetical protein
MGKVISRRVITKDEDLLQLKAGPISILSGSNLKTSSSASSQKQNEEADRIDATAGTQ